MKKILVFLSIIYNLQAIELIHLGVSSSYAETCAGIQSSLNAAVGGDEVRLTAGVLYSCNTTVITLPKHLGASQTIVRTSNYARLPEGNTRICPTGSTAQAGVITYPCTSNILSSGGVAGSSGGDLAIIQWDSPFTFGIIPALGASDWIITGLELRGTSNVGYSALVDFFVTGSNILDRAQRIVFDKCWFHGYLNTIGPQKAIRADGSGIVIQNSVIEEFKYGGADGQGITFQSGPGPLLAKNNFLAGGAENYFSGGSTSAWRGAMPSFLTFIGNYSTRDTRWWIVTVASAAAPIGNCISGRYYGLSSGTDWYQCQAGAWVHIGAIGPPTNIYSTIKNLFELKAMNSALVSGNVFDNSWTCCSQKYAVLFNDAGSQNGYYYGVKNVKLQFNKVSNSSGGISISTPLIDKVIVAYNLLDTVTIYERENNGVVGANVSGGTVSIQTYSLPYQVNGLVVRHNTVVRSGIMAGDGTISRYSLYSRTGVDACPLCQILDNIMPFNVAPITGDSVPTATTFFGTTGNRSWPNGRAIANVIAMDGATPTVNYKTALTGGVPCCTGNWLPTLTTDVITNPGIDNTVLHSGTACGTPCNGLATDGTDPGIDVATLNAYTLTSTNGAFNSYLDFKLGSWLAGTTIATIYYQAPNTSSCSLILSINESMTPTVGVVSEIASGVARTVSITGLTAGTHYWYQTTCGVAVQKADLRTRV